MDRARLRGHHQRALDLVRATSPGAPQRCIAAAPATIGAAKDVPDIQK